MNVFNHSGAQGDIIYSLPTIKRLGGGVLRINQPDEVVDNLRPLLMMQDYIVDVWGTDHTPIENHSYFDLDLFRQQPDLHKNHLVLSHMRAFEVDEANWTEPWLEPLDGPFKRIDYAVVNMTPRYHAKGFNWHREIDYLKGMYKNVIFLGEEKDNICGLDYVKTNNALELATVISHSRMFIGNQSLALAIAEGLGHPYRMVRGDGLTNCDMGTPNEYIINQ